MSACQTCALIERRDRGEAPLWDSILRTPRWDVVHAYGTSLPGWLCLIVRRHITSVADMTEEEAVDVGRLVRDVSAALQNVTACAKTYVVQFAEHQDHPHVHFHVIPRHPDLEDEFQGPRVFALLGVAPEDEVPESTRDKIAQELRTWLPR